MKSRNKYIHRRFKRRVTSFNLLSKEQGKEYRKNVKFYYNLKSLGGNTRSRQIQNLFNKKWQRVFSSKEIK